MAKGFYKKFGNIELTKTEDGRYFVGTKKSKGLYKIF
jgi:hypothetical protein